MKIKHTLSLVAVAALLASPVYAASRPVSMRLMAYSQSEAGDTVRHFVVTCSSGDKVSINHFKAQGQWCNADGNACTGRKISAAKTACRAGLASHREHIAAAPL